jgi:hypothetical protein
MNNLPRIVETGTLNIQHSTPNIEWGALWMLRVECWELNVSPTFHA